ncbi:benomyl/methotrexate resistance protein [Plectosphaerella cucumerina]|uniref:Benomyl/methotrexate resistance protein n=1 Tax=Plectosphaerella cucumerina TaxID=40658 RepID=A0A8K0T8E0_9PEZI|nr:benomyl/methotrexate resistance protein [Plectosphaerella cucumerina]
MSSHKPGEAPDVATADDATLDVRGDDASRLREPPSADEKTVDISEDKNTAAVPNDDPEKAQPASSTAPAKPMIGVKTPDDPDNIVGWDGPDDPENPYNWPAWRKVANCGAISALTFVTPLASSMFAPGVPLLMREFESRSTTLASFVVSVFVLGFAAGPLLCAPLSEIYGRLPVYHVCNVLFVIFNIACAVAPNMTSLIVFRFFAGCFGSAPLTIGGGTIADMIVQEKRGGAMAVFSIGPLLGPIIGPVGGGFFAEAAGWRWVFWLLAILSGIISIVMFFVLRESYAMILLKRRTERLRKETGNQDLRSKLDPGLSPTDFFKRGIIRPLKLLAKSPITQIFAVYIAIAYGYLYLMFTSITQVFIQYYGFTPGTAGLAFLGLGVGSLLGLAFFAGFSDRWLKRKAAQEKAAGLAAGREPGPLKPEPRLITLPVGAVLLPAGLFWYGWSANNGSTHWIVPIIGTAVVGLGNLVIFLALQMYLVDAFAIYAASALAANTVARSVAGAFLPMAGLPMYEKLGLGWGNSLLGFIAVGMIPVSLLIIKYGELLRTKYEVKNL